MPENPWLAGGDADRGTSYQRRLAAKAASGAYLHAEADLVEGLGARTVLDAGCGTGRVAVELARRGLSVVGVDVDPSMLAVARGASEDVEWVEADLVSVDLGRTVDVVLAAGNVMVFLTPGTLDAVVARLAAHLAPGGHLVAGFALRGGPSPIELPLATYDQACEAAGLVLVDRRATWEGEGYAGGDYAVSTHRLVA
ncbi:trans-aconitate 2-methyltransferase [Euzebya sp.]|uniref:class I SAM-dependent methyltransferase n=1 Tax=Euzebya sp. TaxID=1971409 RepID=UPI003515EA43